MYIFSPKFNLKLNLLNSLTRVIDDNNGVQTDKFWIYKMQNQLLRGLCLLWRNVAQKKEDKVNNDGTVQDLQVTNLFLSMCGQDAIIKLRSLMSPRNLTDTPYKDIRLAIQNYISPKERVVTAEKAKFLSVIPGVGESDDDFLARLREKKHAIVTSRN